VGAEVDSIDAAVQDPHVVVVAAHVMDEDEEASSGWRRWWAIRKVRSKVMAH
jgi:hypothetical protein